MAVYDVEWRRDKDEFVAHSNEPQHPAGDAGYSPLAQQFAEFSRRLLTAGTVADALSAVPGMVVDSATAMGYRPLRRFLSVELPLSVPVVLAGLRVAAVSSISLVTVGSVMRTL